jgi:hypothetical protein
VTCRECGAPVLRGIFEGEPLVVDAHETIRGDHRYAFADGDRLVAVAPTKDALAHTDHRVTCPKRVVR